LCDVSLPAEMSILVGPEVRDGGHVGEEQGRREDEPEEPEHPHRRPEEDAALAGILAASRA